MIDPELQGKVVLITGANNPLGIGAAIARGFAAQGSRLFLHFHRESNLAEQGHETSSLPSPSDRFYSLQQTKSADEVLAAVHAAGADALAAEGDLSDSNLVPALFDQAERQLGPVELLINNAAHWERDTFLPADIELSNKVVELWTGRPPSITTESFDRIFALNTRAHALLTRELAQRHIQRGAAWGRIVNISSDGAWCGPSEVTYFASKLALESYTRSAATELGRLGITVNAIPPGPVQTGWITPQLEKEILPAIPLRRIGTPEEVADVAVFLASSQARWITGQRLYVRGEHVM